MTISGIDNEGAAEERWRPVRRYRLGAALPWIAVFYLAVLLLHFRPGLEEGAAPLAWLLMLALLLAATSVLRFAMRLVGPVLAPPVETPPPSPVATDAVYGRPPKPNYPPLAWARGQCGWVVLRLRVDASGRVSSYAVIDQAPGRTFERAVVRSLARARVEVPMGAAAPSVVTTVVKFVSRKAHAPEWARTMAP